MRRQIIQGLLIVIVFLQACESAQLGQPATDSVAPGKLTHVKVKNIPGGAVISYSLPLDEDLLYVKAVYDLKGGERDMKASLFTDSLVVNGFGDTINYPVRLYCVDRSENQSEGVEVTVKPLTPPVQMIQKTLSIIKDFGGVTYQWNNPTNAEVSIYLLAADSLGNLETSDVVYTSSREGKYSLRGFDVSKRVFGAYVTDRWDNQSGVITDTLEPLYEVELDRKLFKAEVCPGDEIKTWDAGWKIENMWDGVTVAEWSGWHTYREGRPMPAYVTIDLGQEVKLSRYKLWHRSGQYLYGHHNPKEWRVYGTSEINKSNWTEEYWTTGNWTDDWVKLLDCVCVKPSGDGPVTNEDTEFANNGFEFMFPLDAPAVRYIRLAIDKTWSGGTDVHIMELKFWGEPVNRKK